MRLIKQVKERIILLIILLMLPIISSCDYIKNDNHFIAGKYKGVNCMLTLTLIDEQQYLNANDINVVKDGSNSEYKNCCYEIDFRIYDNEVNDYKKVDIKGKLKSNSAYSGQPNYYYHEHGGILPTSNAIEISYDSTNYILRLIDEKYRPYYIFNAMKGLELYCYKEDNSWYCCLMMGTNRHKTIEEVSYLQQNYKCPIIDMRKILYSYSEDEIKDILVCIISNPPTNDELTHAYNEKYHDDYVEIYKVLGLNINTK